MIKRIAAAISLFTRIPISRWIVIPHSYYGQTAPYYPVTGWLVGGLTGAAFYLSDFFFTQPVSVALALIFSIFLTGGLQEGGLAYFFDNLGGRHGQRFYSRSRIDKGIGIQGILGVALNLILQFAVLQEISPALVPWVFLSADSLARLSAITLIDTNRYLRPKEGYDQAPVFGSLGGWGWVSSIFFGLTPVLITLPYKVWLAIIPAFIVRIILGIFFKKRRGGINFEECMATQHFSIVAFYLGISAIPNI